MHEPPGEHTTLEHYPWVVVRFRCTRCRVFRDRRLAWLAEEFTAAVTIGQLVELFQKNCPHRLRKRNGRPISWEFPCGFYALDLGSHLPPDLPPSSSGLTLIEGGRDDMLPAEPSREKRRRRIGET